MTDDEKIASILSDIKDYIGSYYTEMIVEVATKKQLLSLIKASEDKNINAKDRARLAVGYYLPAKITLTIPVEGVHNGFHDLNETAMGIVILLKENIGLDVSKIHIGSVFPFADFNANVNMESSKRCNCGKDCDIHDYVEDYDENVREHQEEEHQEEDKEDPDWVAKWEELYNKKT